MHADENKFLICVHLRVSAAELCLLNPHNRRRRTAEALAGFVVGGRRGVRSQIGGWTRSQRTRLRRQILVAIGARVIRDREQLAAIGELPVDRHHAAQQIAAPLRGELTIRRYRLRNILIRLLNVVNQRAVPQRDPVLRRGDLVARRHTLDFQRKLHLDLVAGLPVALDYGVALLDGGLHLLAFYRYLHDAFYFRRRRVQLARRTIRNAQAHGEILRLFGIHRDRDLAAPRVIRLLHYLNVGARRVLQRDAAADVHVDVHAIGG